MKHIAWYGILGGVLVGAVSMFFANQGNPSVQLLAGIITSIAYFAWGIAFHTAQKDLHAKVVIEYMLIAAIAIVLLFAILT